MNCRRPRSARFRKRISTTRRNARRRRPDRRRPDERRSYATPRAALDAMADRLSWRVEQRVKFEGGQKMDQLSSMDASFLHLETPETPMHVGSLMLFELPEGYT